MLKSMTAYGRGSVEKKLGCFTIEIQTLNRKHLEINCFMPQELLRFDAEIKKWIGCCVFRGQITVRISAKFTEESPLTVKPNLPLARQLKKAWEEIARELNLDTQKGMELALLKDVEGILIYTNELPNENDYRLVLHEAVQQALKKLLEMKQLEGKIIYEEIAARFYRMQKIMGEIAARAPDAIAKQRQKLKERLEEVLPGSVENEERLLREICLFAERVDITEELLRFHSHLKQSTDLIASDEPQVGKKLEFLIQELNREVNTVGSKSSDLEIAKQVVEIKSELEKVREQIQNIE